MTQGRTCRHCLALGLLTSALLHGATLYFWSRTALDAPSAPPQVAIDLDLATFADATGTGDAPTEPSPPDPAPADPVSEPPPEPPPPAVYPAKPDPAPTPDSAPDMKPAPQRVVASPPPRERPRPKPAHKPEVKPVPRPLPKPPTPPRPPTRAPRPVDRPPPERPPQVQARAAAPIAAPARSQTGHPGPTGGPAPSAPASTVNLADKVAAEHAYLAELRRAISRWQRFPEQARQRRQTGVATVAFVVTAAGGISQVHIVQSAGDPDLDRAALEALNRLGRFKPIPAVLGRSSWSMRVPIRFDLR